MLLEKLKLLEYHVIANNNIELKIKLSVLCYVSHIM